MDIDLLDRASLGQSTARAAAEAGLLEAWSARRRDELDTALLQLARLASSDRVAAMDLLLRFAQRSGAVRQIVGRYVPGGDVEDVEQQVLIALQRSIGSFQGRSTFMTWLHSLTVNTALAYRRALARRHETPADHAVADDGSGRFSSVVVNRADLTAAAKSLTTDQRRVLALWGQGYSYEEIAADVGVPVGTVRSRISRARERLRELTSTSDDARRADGC